ncbi:Ttc8 [Symbiodinium natans]|uniref:Ttc8 protein n=1 Tax=Symbiodinium natans TaxID=878477 RepID=A0A812R068_9DINO|nr:Ttc8 [Symbiodinium natans]
MRRLLASAQATFACIHQGHTSNANPRLLHHFMFTGSHLVFSLLDRLDCRIWSAVSTQQPSPFWMRLLPSSFSEANTVRGRRQFHRDGAFQDLLQDLLKAGNSTDSSFRFVEVGASLGGCTFHVLTSVRASVAVAVEPYQPTVEAMKQTASWNGLGNRLTVHQTFVSEGQGACRISSLQNNHETRAPHWDFGQEEFPAGTATECAVATLEHILTSTLGTSEL